MPHLPSAQEAPTDQRVDPDTTMESPPLITIATRTTPSSSPVELPEILYVLVQFLDRETILQASRVSHSWHKVFSPILFREVRYQDWKYPEFMDLFRKHLDQVVCLEWRRSRKDAKRRFRECVKRQEQEERSPLSPPPPPPPQQQQQGQQSLLQAVDSVDKFGLSRSPSPNPSIASSIASSGPATPSVEDRICLEDLALTLCPETTPRLKLLAVQGEMELRRFLITVLPKIPTLTCLRIEDSFSWQKIGIGEILNACQNLESLDCDGSVALQFEDAFLQGNPVPEAVCGCGAEHGSMQQQVHGQSNQTHQYQESTSASASSTQAPAGHHPWHTRTQHLQILRLHKTSLSDQDLLQLVGNCPQLRELFLHQEGSGGTLAGGQPLANATATHQWNWSEEFVLSMARSCPNLVKVHLSPGCFQSLPEDILLRVLAAFPRLHSLGVPFSQFGDRTMFEILRTRVHMHGNDPTQGPTSSLSSSPPIRYSPMTSLDLTNLKGHRLSSSVLQTFLENCPELLHFKGDAQMLKVQDMVTQDTQDPTSTMFTTAVPAELRLRPWACRRLETLVIGFEYCYDLTKIGYGSSYPVAGCSSVWESEDEIVYQQLSRLTKLRKLELLQDSPNWNISSKGMTALSGLGVLQTFRISSAPVTSRMGASASSQQQQQQQKDLARWIASAWPCLQTLYVPGSGLLQRNKDWYRLLHELGRSNIRVLPTDED
ncbi:hypothetical protein BGZ83_006000 [Gryganskiella cystojenkinii]|nr:hypothetical protein BGZ83_006000 [Gryganskiella cystojenkinii]